MPPRRPAPQAPVAEPAGGLDAAELRRRIEQHLAEHAAAGDTAAIDVEEVVLHADTGKVTVQHERAVVQPHRPPQPASRLADLAVDGAGERVLGLPVEWYLRLAWPYAALGGVLYAVAAWAEAPSWLLTLAAAAIALGTGVAAGKRQVSLPQSAVAGATAGAAAGLLASVLALVTRWTLGNFLNLVALPAYLALAGAVLAPVAAWVWRRSLSDR